MKAEFSYLKAFEKDLAATPSDLANAQADIIYTMGVMGHYVGDGAQPLHVTKHHHGWVGENPQGYATRKTIHSEVDGFFRGLDTAGVNSLAQQIHPAKLPAAELGIRYSGDPFNAIMAYLFETEKNVVPLYELDKAGKLFAPGEAGLEGKAFLSKRVIAGGQMLGDFWFSAWQSAPEDTYLEGTLAKRKLHADAAATKN